jgi:ectoine hydroxylase-related dioxygenase (phytanoyl-CoA dioxygenase family)
VCVRAGDAVVLDYRLLHGTLPNASLNGRDAILLSFTPYWRGLPTDVRAHLIQHPALPSGDEPVSSMTWSYGLLPTFNGPRTDLPINRRPPSRFVCGE